MSEQRLKGQVALITGGGTGMGRSTALLFSKEGAGVLINGRHEDTLKQTVGEIRSAGGTASYHVGDVSKWSEVRALVDSALSEYGQIDLLVTSAGTIRRTEKVEETTEEQWDILIDVNLKGTFAAIRYVLPHMMEKKRGNIITISSTSAQLAAPGYATYCASKGGVSALTRCVALQYASYNIRANAICPGMTKTPMAYIDRPKPFDEIVDSVLEQSYPIKRVGLPEDVANAALFLASDESSYITGQELFVDGGFSIR